MPQASEIAPVLYDRLRRTFDRTLLRQEMASRGMTIRFLAGSSGLSMATVKSALAGHRVSFVTHDAIMEALGAAPLLRQAV